MADTFEDFNWHSDDDGIVCFSNLVTDPMTILPLDFLQSLLPQGLGFSSDCSIWLDKLSSKTWDEFVSHSLTYTVLSMMSTLSVPVYHRHRKHLC